MTLDGAAANFGSPVARIFSPIVSASLLSGPSPPPPPAEPSPHLPAPPPSPPAPALPPDARFSTVLGVSTSMVLFVLICAICAAALVVKLRNRSHRRKRRELLVYRLTGGGGVAMPG